MTYSCEKCKKEFHYVKDGGVVVENHYNCWSCAQADGVRPVVYRYPEALATSRARFWDNFDLLFFGERPGVYAHAGIELECEFGIWPGPASFNTPRMLAVKADGSLSSWGVEVLTQPSAGPEIFTTMKEVVGYMKDRYWQGTVRCGQHVHVDFAKPKLYEVKNLMMLMFLLEPYIYSLFRRDRWTSRYCQPLTSVFNLETLINIDTVSVDRLYYGQPSFISKRALSREKRHHLNQRRYMGTNIHSIFFRKTAEFRMPHVEMNPDYSSATALLFAGIVEHVRSKKRVNRDIEILSRSFIGVEISKEDGRRVLDTINSPSMVLLRQTFPDFLK